MVSATGPRLELDLVTLAWSTLALAVVLAVAFPIASFYFGIYLHPLRVLDGPKIQHWYFGSWSKEVWVGGKLEEQILHEIEKYGPVFQFISLGRRRTLAVSDHRAANKVFQTPFQRHARANAILRRHVGRGLLTEDGAIHTKQRKIAYPAFTLKAVYDMQPTFLEKTDQFTARLLREYNKASDAGPKTQGARINIARELNRVTLDIIGAVGFGYEFHSLLQEGSEATDLENAFQKCLHLISTGTLYAAMRVALGEPVVKLGRLLGVKEQRELDEAREIVESVSAELVRRAKKNAGEGENSTARDLLSLMVRANTSEDVKPTQRLSDLELQQMVPVFMIAGHETTSTAASWACYSFIQGERGLEIQNRIREELAQASGWREDAKIIDNLPYMDGMVKEILRAHCPVRQMGRQAPADTVLPLARPVTLKDGTKMDHVKVKKGDIVLLSIKHMNTDPELWGPDAGEFRPERWLPEGHAYAKEGSQVHPTVKELKGVYSHLMSFGGGPNACIGLRLSIVEMKYILAALVTNFDVLPPNLPGEDPVKIMSISQIVAHPMVEGEWEKGLAMPVRIRPRAAA